jgi:secondary thiamine-phosphate synthase enzyme
MILSVKTTGRTEMIDITEEVQSAVRSSGLEDGLCMIYVPHTTAAVTINENADPSVPKDLLMVINQIVPWEAPYQHAEGNSPAHVKTTLVGSSELVSVQQGRLVLGTWQSIFFCEFDGPRSRKVHIRFLSTGSVMTG